MAPENSPVQAKRILDLINKARSTYKASELKRLIPGQLRSASFCPLGRSFRQEVEDWLFTAVGTRYLRLWTPRKETIEVAKEILKAWTIPERLLKRTGEKSGYVLIPLPFELRQFVNLFDQGLLPEYQGQVDQQEIQRLREMAQAMPIPGRQRKLFWDGMRGSGSQDPFAQVSL